MLCRSPYAMARTPHHISNPVRRATVWDGRTGRRTAAAWAERSPGHFCFFFIPHFSSGGGRRLHNRWMGARRWPHIWQQPRPSTELSSSLTLSTVTTCIHNDIHVYAHVYAHVCTHVYTHDRTHVYTHVQTRVYTHVCTHAHTYIYAPVYSYIY